MNHNRRSSTAFVFAMAAAVVAPAALAGTDDDALQEVIVTAERREQNLQDVPVAVTALTARELEERGITDYGQYLSSVPGAAYADLGNQGNEVKFRGVGAGTQQLSPTTAVYLGDVPVIHTGRSLNSSYDFYLADMERIELLRGPQGQLYGANSLGGAIKNIPNKAHADAFAVNAKLTESTTHSPGGTNYGGELTANIPLITDALAVRFTGYGQRMSGWYDNVFAGGPKLGTLAQYAPPLVQPPGPPGTPIVGAPWSYFPANLLVYHPVPPPGHVSVLPNSGVLALDPAAAGYAAPANLARDVNRSGLAGGRMMLDWQATDRASAELMVTYESKRTYGTAWAEEIPNKPDTAIPGTYSSVTPVLYPSNALAYQQINTVNAGNADEIFLANLQLDYKLDFATVTANISFWDRTATLQTDLSPIAFTVTQVSGTIPILVSRADNPRSFIEELRVTSSGSGPLSWLGGVFYQRLNQGFHAGVDELSGLNIVYTRALVQAELTHTPIPPSAPFGSQDGDFTDEQLAGFGELKYDILPGLNAGFSFRYIDLRQWSVLDNSGFFYFGQPNTQRSAKESQFTPKYTLSWTPAQNELFYATAAKGFRSGITNLEAPLSICAQELANAGEPNGIQPTRPDTLWNYELGAKMAFADRRVTVDAAVYHIKWTNLQTQIILTNFFKPTATQTTSACTYPAVFNVGDATIDGQELEVNARLIGGLQANVSFAHTQPRYESNVPQDNIHQGETIDGTPNITGYAGLHYDFNVWRHRAFAQADVTYVGHIVAKSTDFQVQAQPFPIGEYALVGARLGYELTNTLKLEAFIDNAFNRYAITRELDNAGSTVPTVFTTRPRTFGLTLRYGL